MRFVKFISVIAIYLIVAGGLCAQTSTDFGTTGNTSKTPNNKQKNKDFKNRRLVHWIKYDGKGLLIGNACMNEVTQNMGFEYVLQAKGQSGNRNEFGRLMHNFGAKTIILFKNGPFWKIKLKRKRKECRRLTGDHLG